MAWGTKFCETVRGRKLPCSLPKFCSCCYKMNTGTITSLGFGSLLQLRLRHHGSAVGWFAFGVRAGSRQKGQLNRFSKYPTHHLKYEEGTLTLVSHDSIKCFLPVIWSNVLTAVMSKLLQIQWAMGFTEPWGRTLGASWECYCWSVVAVLIVEKFRKRGLFWIDFSLGMAGIFIFI